jgi:hypothetical protein
LIVITPDVCARTRHVSSIGCVAWLRGKRDDRDTMNVWRSDIHCSKRASNAFRVIMNV